MAALTPLQKKLYKTFLTQDLSLFESKRRTGLMNESLTHFAPTTIVCPLLNGGLYAKMALNPNLSKPANIWWRFQGRYAVNPLSFREGSNFNSAIESAKV
ncbi:hypothetical protein HK102_000931 [Quaeritorhiza haematococci]|nr:hypothetical protein HK102_000931 [Quaeritorhiza haematococci]